MTLKQSKKNSETLYQDEYNKTKDKLDALLNDINSVSDLREIRLLEGKKKLLLKLMMNETLRS